MSFRLTSSSGLGALLAGAVFLWLGFVLAVLVTIFGGLALLPARLRRLCSRQPAPRRPVTIEGRYTRMRR